MMSSYRVGIAPDSDTLAYVSPDPDAPGRWTLAANEAFADDRDLLTSTLVHEFAHVLSLNTTEIDADSGPCPTLAVSEGCARAGSAILDFQRQFWAAYADARTRTTTTVRSPMPSTPPTRRISSARMPRPTSSRTSPRRS
jgi:hypothetical protein